MIGEDGTAAVSGVSAQNRARGAHLDVEAFAADGARIRVEQDGDLVARGILELLDHQLAAPRSGAPVHLPQRLSLLVLTDGVEVEARWAAQQQTPPVLRVGAALREEPVECDEPRVDEQRAARGQVDLDPREPERVVDRRPRLLDDVPPPRHPFEHVGAPVQLARTPEWCLSEAEPGDLLGDDDRRRRHARLRAALRA